MSCIYACNCDFNHHFTNDVVTFVIYDHGDHDEIKFVKNDEWLSEEAQDIVNLYYGNSDIDSVKEVLGCFCHPNKQKEGKGYLFVRLLDGTEDVYTTDLDANELKQLEHKYGFIENEKIKKTEYELTYDPMPWWWMGSGSYNVDCRCEEMERFKAENAGVEYDYDNVVDFGPVRHLTSHWAYASNAF